MSHEVDDVYDRKFADYLELAGEKLSRTCPSSEHQWEFQDYLDRLRVHFLFPDLDDEERNLLVGLLNARRALQLAIGMLGPRQREIPTEELPRLESIAKGHEDTFMSLKNLYERGVAQKLTAFQKQILEQKFLDTRFQ